MHVQSENGKNVSEKIKANKCIEKSSSVSGQLEGRYPRYIPKLVAKVKVSANHHLTDPVVYKQEVN